MPLIIRLGDTSSHGGEIITAAVKTYAEGKRIARIGDILSCPEHGDNEITEGSPNTFVEGKQVARDGDQASCGARLISSAAKTFIN